MPTDTPRRRGRPNDPRVTARRESVLQIAREQQPMSVRGLYYQASVHGLVEKTENGYGKVQHDSVLLRKSGQLPYGWITDSTRLQRKPTTYNSIEAALRDTAQLYRRNLWRDADCYVEVWLEKHAMSGVVYPVTAEYDVPLMISRGYSSLTFLYDAACYIAAINRPTYIYHLGDLDPSGVNAAENIESTLREFAPHAEIHFKRLGVTLEQVFELDLPTRHTKLTDTRREKFREFCTKHSAQFGPAFHEKFGRGDQSVEMDAIPPNTLRAIVRQAIEQHLPPEQLEVLHVAEESERSIMLELVRQAGEAGYFA